MRSSRVLAITLVSSSHVSLCAGSLLSVLLALLANVAHGQPPVAAMTPAIGGSVCLLQTPSDRTSEIPAESSCGEGKDCFEAVAFSLHKADILGVPLMAVVLPEGKHPETLWSDASRANIVSLPHRPPGHERLLALSVVQRE